MIGFRPEPGGEPWPTELGPDLSTVDDLPALAGALVVRSGAPSADSGVPRDGRCCQRTYDAVVALTRPVDPG